MQKIKNTREFQFSRISPGLIGNIIYNMMIYKASKRLFLKPLLPSYFITTRCNLRCSYCRISEMRYPELNTKDAFRVLEKIRPGNQALSITGGETLLRRDIIQILKKARQLNFKPVFFNTNGLMLSENEKVLEYIDYLIISLDTLNCEKWNKILGVKGASEKIINNIKRYAAHQKDYGYRMIINPVITSQNIEDIYQIIEFCRNYGLLISPVPCDINFYPEAALVNNSKYFQLIDVLLELKHSGDKHIVVSSKYLRQIKEFSIHDCLSLMVPRIFPDGSVFYPCTAYQKIYANILDYPNLNLLLREAFQERPLPDCYRQTKKCFMSCFMEPVNMINNPLGIIIEQLKSISQIAKQEQKHLNINKIEHFS